MTYSGAGYTGTGSGYPYGGSYIEGYDDYGKGGGGGGCCGCCCGGGDEEEAYEPATPDYSVDEDRRALIIERGYLDDDLEASKMDATAYYSILTGIGRGAEKAEKACLCFKYLKIMRVLQKSKHDYQPLKLAAQNRLEQENRTLSSGVRLSAVGRIITGKKYSSDDLAFSEVESKYADTSTDNLKRENKIMKEQLLIVEKAACKYKNAVEILFEEIRDSNHKSLPRRYGAYIAVIRSAMQGVDTNSHEPQEIRGLWDPGTGLQNSAYDYYYGAEPTPASYASYGTKGNDYSGGYSGDYSGYGYSDDYYY